MLILLLFLSVSLDVVRELCFKQAARGQLFMTDPLAARSIAVPMENVIWTSAGFVCWGLEILCCAQVFARLPLNAAIPVMSMTYALTPVASWFLLGERISSRRWIGIWLVTAGVILVGSSAIR